MTVCILGNSLTALTLAKALVNQNIYVNILRNKKNPNIEMIIPKISASLLIAKLSTKLAVFFIFIQMNQFNHFVSSNFYC